VLTGAQMRAARALIKMRQVDLAKAADLSEETIKRLEKDSGPVQSTANNAAAIQKALEAAGVVFLPENGNGPGVALRKS